MLKRPIKCLEIITLLVSLIAFISCTNKETTTASSEIDYRSGILFPNYEERNSGLGRLMHKADTLKIIVEFSDCGEWGGRRETILIQSDSNGKIAARFLKDSVSCENIKSYGDYAEIDNDSRVIIRDTSKILTAADEKLINLFLHRLLEVYLNKEDFHDGILHNFYVDSGTTLKVMNSDSTLNLYFWNIDSMSNTWYGHVRSKVFNEHSHTKR